MLWQRKSSHLFYPQPGRVEWSLGPRPALNLSRQRARSGEATAQRGRQGKRSAKPKPRPWAGCLEPDLPAGPTPPRESAPAGASEWETPPARPGPRVSHLRPPQGVVLGKLTAPGSQSWRSPGCWAPSGWVTHREDTHADWGLQQARHLELSHPAAAGAGARPALSTATYGASSRILCGKPDELRGTDRAPGVA